MKQMKGLRSTDWLLQNSHGNVNYSIGNTVSDIVITVHGARWIFEILGVFEIFEINFVKFMIV